MQQRISKREEVTLDLLVNIVHCIQKQHSLSASVKADRINRYMPVSVPTVHPRNEPRLGLQPVISVTYKEHLILQVFQMRTRKQP
jgi:hypothetical protein